MSTSYQQEDSDEDAFESADEGELTISSIVDSPVNHSSISPVPEPVPSPSTNPVTVSSPSNADLELDSSKPVLDGWDDWNIDDEQIVEQPIIVTREMPIDSASSLSSSPSKTGDSISQIASDEDEQLQTASQQRLQKKKLRKKSSETANNKEETKTSTRPSRTVERRDAETTSTTKHSVQDAHHVLDRLSAQSPTRTVRNEEFYILSVYK